MPTASIEAGRAGKSGIFCLPGLAGLLLTAESMPARPRAEPESQVVAVVKGLDSISLTILKTFW